MIRFFERKDKIIFTFILSFLIFFTFKINSFGYSYLSANIGNKNDTYIYLINDNIYNYLDNLYKYNLDPDSEWINIFENYKNLENNKYNYKIIYYFKNNANIYTYNIIYSDQPLYFTNDGIPKLRINNGNFSYFRFDYIFDNDGDFKIHRDGNFIYKNNYSGLIDDSVYGDLSYYSIVLSNYDIKYKDNNIYLKYESIVDNFLLDFEIIFNNIILIFKSFIDLIISHSLLLVFSIFSIFILLIKLFKILFKR